MKYAFGSHFRKFAVKRTKLSRVALVAPHPDEVSGQCGVQAAILLLTSTPSPFRHGSTKPITSSSIQAMVGKSTPELDYETVATCQRIYDFFLRFMGHLLSCTRGQALALDLREMAINVSGIVVVGMHVYCISLTLHTLDRFGSLSSWICCPSLLHNSVVFAGH